uniref:Uncharacterized protein n=1 Tax=Avena sativa TaxID=4498 RepID=A0ACD6AUC3_AVESA
MVNKYRRTLEIDGKCKICGLCEEDSYHATVYCTKAKALRHEMRKFWKIPEEKAFTYTGKDWLPIMLANCGKDERALVLMILWRSWHLRCNIIHGSGSETIANSRVFLLNYMSCLRNTPEDGNQTKGKTQVSFLPSTNGNLMDTGQPKDKAIIMPTWRAPASGTACINVDAAFSETGREATAGIIMRDQSGSICLAACHPTTRSSNIEEAEANAILLGLQIARDYDFVPSSVLSDCFGAVTKANCHSRINNSAWSIYEDIHQLKLYFADCSISHTRREFNTTAHELETMIIN